MSIIPENCVSVELASIFALIRTPLLKNLFNTKFSGKFYLEETSTLLKIFFERKINWYGESVYELGGHISLE